MRGRNLIISYIIVISVMSLFISVLTGVPFIEPALGITLTILALHAGSAFAKLLWSVVIRWKK